MSNEMPDWDTLWVDLAMGELTQEDLEVLEGQIENDPAQKARLEALRRELALLGHIPEGPPLPHSVVVPQLEAPLASQASLGSEDEGAAPLERLPPALEARVKSIFQTSPPPQTGAHSFWQRLWSGANWKWALAATAALVLVLVIPSLLNQPNTDFAKKDGQTTSNPPRRAPVSLSLVARDTPDGPVYRLPLAELRPGVHGCRVRPGQTLLPVLQSWEVDLDASPRYIRVVLLDSSNVVRSLAGFDKATRLSRLPDTDHLFALPEPVTLPANPPLAAGLYRLFVLVTTSPVSEAQLERAGSKRVVKDLLKPGSLLDPALSQVDGLEATILLEVQ